MVFSFYRNCSNVFIWTLDNKTASGTTTDTCLGSCCAQSGTCFTCKNINLIIIRYL